MLALLIRTVVALVAVPVAADVVAVAVALGAIKTPLDSTR